MGNHSPPTQQQEQQQNNTNSNIETLREKEVAKNGASTTQLKLRLMSSNSANSTMTLSKIPKNFTISQAKQLLSHHYHSISGNQKWFLSGRILHDDSKIKNCKIPDDFIVQV